MIYVKESERKFIDKGAVKSHHLFANYDQGICDSHWSPILNFDNKYIQPETKDKQDFLEGDLLVVRILLSGTAIYSDESDEQVRLRPKDILSVALPERGGHSTLCNTDSLLENDLLEIWLKLSGKISAQHRIVSSLSPDSTQIGPVKTIKIHQVKYSIGNFSAGSLLSFVPDGGHRRLLIFIIEGHALVAGKQLLYRDTLLLSVFEPLKIIICDHSEILLIEMDPLDDESDTIKRSQN